MDSRAVDRVGEVEQLLRGVSEQRARGDWEAAFVAAQSAMEAVPADGTLTREEHNDLLQRCWLTRERAMDRLITARQDRGPAYRGGPALDVRRAVIARVVLVVCVSVVVVVVAVGTVSLW